MRVFRLYPRRIPYFGSLLQGFTQGNPFIGGLFIACHLFDFRFQFREQRLVDGSGNCFLCGNERNATAVIPASSPRVFNRLPLDGRRPPRYASHAAAKDSCGKNDRPVRKAFFGTPPDVLSAFFFGHAFQRALNRIFQIFGHPLDSPGPHRADYRLNTPGKACNPAIKPVSYNAHSPIKYMVGRTRRILRKHGVKTDAVKEPCRPTERGGLQQRVVNADVVLSQLFIKSHAFRCPAQGGTQKRIGHIAKDRRELFSPCIADRSDKPGKALVTKETPRIVKDLLTADAPAHGRKLPQNLARLIGVIASESLYCLPGIGQPGELHQPTERLYSLIRTLRNVERRARQYRQRFGHCLA